MKISPRVYRSTGLLIATVVVGLGAGAVRPDVREEQQVPYRWIPYPDVDVARIRLDLPRLLSSPCDELEAPIGNEIHDCQRFVMRVGESPEFGSLIGIFPDVGVLQLGDGDFTRPRAAAFITNAGGNLRAGDDYRDYGYPPLQIEPKSTGADIPAQYCLWMMTAEERGATTWRAAITANREQNLNERQAGCVTPPSPTDRAWSLLRVTPQRYARAEPNEYPATARWMWTTPRSFNGEHYIVVKCGDQQCAITSRAAPAQPTALEGRTARAAIAGWNDAQFLAVGATGHLRPGPWGVVSPLRPPERHRLPVPTGWMAAAEFQVYGEADAYQEKLHLTETEAGLWESRLMIDLQATGGGPRFKLVGDSETTPGQVNTSDSGHGPHGSARWRWRYYDESVWVPCYSFGCCDVDPGD